MGPRGREVRCRVDAAQVLYAAVLLDQLELLVGVEYEAVEEGELVERPGDGAFHAGAVVTPDVEDERVVQVAHLLDGVEQPPDVPVGVLRVPGEHLGLAGVELLLVVRERVPRGEDVRALGELGVSGDDPELLLAGERLLAQPIPALVELALVLVGPFLADVVRCVAATGRVVHHPRLGGVLRADRVQPLDRLVGEVVGEVVLLAVLALGHPDRPVVLGDDRVVLAGGAARGTPTSDRSPRTSASGRTVRPRPGRCRASGATCRSHR